MTAATPTIDRLCTNTIRTLAIDGVQKANSGHPGLPLGAAPLAYTLWQKHLAFDPSAPGWADRDRFVLSAGHGSMLLYALLHLYGFPLSLDDVKAFRQWGSKTPGHPEFGLTAGVEATTGPLGQGAANAVGMAIAERWLAAHFNRPGHAIVDHRTFALMGDGCLMEGISYEAASLAGHLKLGKLVWLYDSNAISLDGPTALSFTEDVAKRMEACGWRVLTVADGNEDFAALDAALKTARQDVGQPTFVVVKTTIGFGSPKKAGTHHVHGSPLGDEELAATKKALGFDPAQSFAVPSEAKAAFAAAGARGQQARLDWEKRLAAWAVAFPALAAEWKTMQAGELPAGWDAELLSFPATQGLATRQSGGKAVNHFAAKIPWLIGGDADLSVSTNTAIEKGGDFDGGAGAGGRNLRYGVREHAMGAIANGIACHGGPRTYTATFFCFSDYMKPAIRLAALSHLPTIFAFTHDSIGLGEDGPTHQPVEHLAALRATPNVHVVRPCDANEAVEAWRYALARTHGPTVLVFSRQKTTTWDRAKCGAAAGLRRGAYVLAEAGGGKPRALLIATGSEVEVAMAAREQLEAKGVPTRVVSMACQEQFLAQDAAWRESVLPSGVAARVSIEAAATFGWQRFLGASGVAIGVDRFGASAPAERIYAEYGLTAAAVVAAVQQQLR
ncbi:MAG: transketolase [Planctomycetes bacterium]|nr:transketolase [Planctomycetota bacterium]